MEAIELTTKQTQTKDYIVCSDEKAILLRCLEILKDKGVIEEDYYYNYKNYYNCYSEKYFIYINNIFWEYLEMLDDEGIIEDYAKEYAVEQFYNSYNSVIIRWICHKATINDIIGEFGEDFENEPDKDDFDIYEFKVFLRKYINKVIMEKVKNYAIFSVVDKYTGATFNIPNNSKYFDYFEDVVYEYVYNSVEYAFNKASEKYPFMGKF